MATLNFGDLRKGLAIEIDGQPYEVMDYTRHKMQQRAPVTRVKVKNLLNGSVTEKTFQAYETSFTPANVSSATTQYLYFDGEFFNFMDLETYDQHQLTREQIGDSINYLKEEVTLEISFFNGDILGVKLPTFVDLQVTDSPPGLKGDTAQGRNQTRHFGDGPLPKRPSFYSRGRNH